MNTCALILMLNVGYYSWNVVRQVSRYPLYLSLYDFFVSAQNILSSKVQTAKLQSRFGRVRGLIRSPRNLPIPLHIFPLRGYKLLGVAFILTRLIAHPDERQCRHIHTYIQCIDIYLYINFYEVTDATLPHPPRKEYPSPKTRKTRGTGHEDWTSKPSQRLMM